jgi:5-methylcytosine-specific restriction endonuclease McrA
MAGPLLTALRANPDLVSFLLPMPDPRSQRPPRRQVRKRVLAEEDTCWICNQPVDKTLPCWLPGSPEVDEIIPVSLGGSPTDRANCRLSHRLCNVRRGNGTRTSRRHLTLKRVRAW